MNDRKVMQQALEALEYLAARPDYETGKAITALRARLAEPQTCKPGLQVEGAEPVAWMLALPDGRLERMSVTSFDDEAEEMLARSIAGCAMVPLYTAPPQRKPLTDEEILEAVGWERAEMYMKLMPNFPVEEAKKETIKNARAIERAHGIGGDE